MSHEHDPRAEWRRAYRASLLGVVAVAAVLAGLGVLATLAEGRTLPPVTPGAAVALVVGVFLLAFLATCAVAGWPRCQADRYRIDDGVLEIDGPDGSRQIPAGRILDLRPDAVILEDGERVHVPSTLQAALRPLYRAALVERVRTTGRTYRHEREQARWAIRLAVVYLLALLAGALVVGIGLALQAGGVGRVAGIGVGLGVWLILWRQVSRRREDQLRAAGLDRVTLDARGVEVVEAGGETSRIRWDEILVVPPPGWNAAIVVETADTIHAIPRSFHPSLARDLRAAWDALSEPDDEESGANPSSGDAAE